MFFKSSLSRYREKIHDRDHNIVRFSPLSHFYIKPFSFSKRKSDHLEIFTNIQKILDFGFFFALLEKSFFFGCTKKDGTENSQLLFSQPDD